jgi:hypothetical protein
MLKITNVFNEKLLSSFYFTMYLKRTQLKVEVCCTQNPKTTLEANVSSVNGDLKKLTAYLKISL